MALMRWSGARWEYLMVIVTLAWPRSSFTDFEMLIKLVMAVLDGVHSVVALGGLLLVSLFSATFRISKYERKNRAKLG